MWIVLAGVAGALALVAAIALVTPFNVEVSAVKAADDSAVRVRVRLRWFGLMLPMPSGRTDKPHTKAGRKPAGRSRAVRWTTVKAVIASPGFLRRVVQLIADEFRLARPRRFYLHARLGFDDPSDTGRFLGWVHALRALPESGTADIRIDPDFTDEVAAGELHVQWSRSLGAILWPVVTFALSPVVWRGVRAGWHARARGSFGTPWSGHRV